MYYDLFTVFESVIWLYRILGCYPYVLREYDDARKYILSPLSVTFNILLFIIGTKYFVVYADTIIDNYDLNSDSLGIMTLGVRQLSNMICVFDSTIVKIFHSRKILRSINSLYSVDEELKNLGYHFNYRLAVRTVPICLIAFLTSMYLFINTEFLLLVDLPIPSLMRLFGNSMILLQMANITLFSFLITNVGFRLKALNASLENLTDCYTENPKVIMVNNKKPEDIVHTSAKIHARLCEVAKLLNGAFVLTIVTSVVQAFVISTAMLYFIFIEFKTGLANEFLTMMPYLTMLLICVLVVIVIVLSCNWTSSQVAGTAKILHQMSLKKMCMDDKSLDEMVRIFSMQILHHNVVFTAAGLFSLDSTLLQSLAGAITTYLVILIQFDPKIK